MANAASVLNAIFENNAAATHANANAHAAHMHMQQPQPNMPSFADTAQPIRFTALPDPTMQPAAMQLAVAHQAALNTDAPGILKGTKFACAVCGTLGHYLNAFTFHE